MENKENHNNSSDSLYLNTLTYKEEDGQTWLNFFIKKFRVTVLIVIAIIIWGITSALGLPQETTPEVKIPFGIITVVMPGASPEDMEEMVIKKVEEKISNLTGIKQITSTASNSFAATTVEFNADEDLKDAIRRLRDSTAGLENDLPEEASAPTVNEVSFSSMPVWTLVVTGPYDSFTLRKYAELVQEELKKLPGTSEVTLSGGDVHEINIAYDPDKLKHYGLAMDQVNNIIRANNFSIPLGSIKISNYEYTLKANGKFEDVKDIRELPLLTINDQQIKLKDVADVVEMAEERKIINTFSNEGNPPQNAIGLSVVKRTGSSIIELIDNGKVALEKLKLENFPADLKIETTMDASLEIRKNLDQLIHDGLITVGLVFMVIFLFVGLKEAFVAGLAVPLVFCVSFGVMSLIGITLNFLSLFSLILSLGLLVDDAIVVVQATKQYLATGKFTPEEAVLLVFRDYKILLTTTTLTTIWAFIPLLLASGIIGEFIRSIPITVSITLAASYFIAIIINHPMAIILERFRVTRVIPKTFLAILGIILLTTILLTSNQTLPTNIGAIAIAAAAFFFFGFWIYYKKVLKARALKNEEMILEEIADPAKIKAKIYHHYLADSSQKSFFSKLIGGVIKLDKVLPGYGRFLDKILRSKLRIFTTLLVTVLLFFSALALPATGLLKSELFPSADSENLYINVEGPPGLTTEQTQKIAEKVQTTLLKEEGIRNFSLISGAGGVDVSGSFSASASSQSNKAQFAITLYPFKERPGAEKSYDIAKKLREKFTNIQEAKVEVVDIAGGPPSGADIEGRITGEDMQILEQEANRYKDILSEIPGVINAKTSISLSPGEFTIKLDYAAMSQNGLSSAQVSALLRTAISPSELTKITQDGEEVSIKAGFEKDSLDTINKIKNLQLINNRGQIFQLSDIAEISLGSSLTSISRIDGDRVIVVTSSVEQPHLPAEVLAEFQKLIAKKPLPKGYEITFGGQNEANEESIVSILRAMIIAMILIVSTLILQFNSFAKAFLVLATIPLAITGVFYGLTILGLSLSFPALIGVVALFGIVVKNAVILVDKINLNLKVGIPFIEAIVDASKSRLEAIFLTSIATIMGMIPLTISDETWAGLGASLIFGLTASTFLTLLVIPILFKIFTKKAQAKIERLDQLKKAVANKNV